LKYHPSEVLRVASTESNFIYHIFKHSL
jgi:hypothetical protein